MHVAMSPQSAIAPLQSGSPLLSKLGHVAGHPKPAFTTASRHFCSVFVRAARNFDASLAIARLHLSAPVVTGVAVGPGSGGGVHVARGVAVSDAVGVAVAVAVGVAVVVGVGVTV